MCKYSYKDFERAAERLEKANAGGDASTVRSFLKGYKKNVKNGPRTAGIIKLCKGVMDTRRPRS